MTPRRLADFERLGRRGRAARLRALGALALARHGIEPARWRTLSFQEQAVFRVDALDGTTWAVRVHGATGNDRQALASELLWLEAIARDTEIVAPAPHRDDAGGLVTTVRHPGVPEPRDCTVLRWVPGPRRRNRPQPSHLRRVGRLMARLHAHASTWTRPEDFRRREWTADAVFGSEGFAGPGGIDPWPLLPDAVRGDFAEGAAAAREAFAKITRRTADVGLIHADLHLWNILFASGEACPIDFEDCGPGPWGYDFAAALAYLRGGASWPDLLAALVGGYEEIRPIPAGHLDDLELMIAGRFVGIGLWCVAVFDMAEDIGVPMRDWMEMLRRNVRTSLDAARV